MLDLVQFLQQSRADNQRKFAEWRGRLTAPVTNAFNEHVVPPVMEHVVGPALANPNVQQALQVASLFDAPDDHFRAANAPLVEGGRLIAGSGSPEEFLRSILTSMTANQAVPQQAAQAIATNQPYEPVQSYGMAGDMVAGLANPMNWANPLDDLARAGRVVGEGADVLGAARRVTRPDGSTFAEIGLKATTPENVPQVLEQLRTNVLDMPAVQARAAQLQGLMDQGVDVTRITEDVRLSVATRAKVTDNVRTAMQTTELPELFTPEARQQMKGVVGAEIARQEGMPGGYRPWYGSQEILQTAVDELGPAEGRAFWEWFMTANAVMSGAAGTRQQSTWALKGLLEQATTGRWQAGRSGVQMDSVVRALKEDFGSAFSPFAQKTSGYADSLMGYLDHVTIDRHNLRSMLHFAGLDVDSPAGRQAIIDRFGIEKKVALDARTGAEFTEAIYGTFSKGGRYGVLEELQAQVAQEMGLAPAEFQALMWTGMAEITGVDASSIAPFVAVFNSALQEQAQASGVKVPDVLRSILRGEITLGAVMGDDMAPFVDRALRGVGRQWEGPDGEQSDVDPSMLDEALNLYNTGGRF